MSFSENYLNKILNSAIKYHNFKNKIMDPLPNMLNDKYTAIDLFKQSLNYEAYQNFKQPNDKNINPILCAVNLNTKEPGIIISKNNEKLCIHTKYSIKTEKTKRKTKPISKKDLDILSDKTYQRLKKHNEKLEKKYLEKKERKDEEIYIKNIKCDTRIETKNLKNIEKKCEKFEKIKTKINQKLEQLEKTPEKYKSTIIKLKEEIINTGDKINDFKNNIELKNNTINKNKDEIEQYNLKKEQQKQLRKNRIEENKLKKIKKQQEIAAIQEAETIQESENILETENIQESENIQETGTIQESEVIQEAGTILESENIQDDKLKKLPLNKIRYSDMFDELHELFQKNDPNEIYDTYNKEIHESMVKIYPSPIPFERHIDAFNKCDPNPILLPSLLYGDKKYGSEFITIFNGPPGTGKTWRLMKELENILKIAPRKKILICAPSNIGVINLYNRALSFGIHGCLILSAKHYPDNFKMPEKQGKNNIVFSTISMRHGRILNGIEFNTIIIDEAAQCPESWIWGLLRNRVTKLIMAGDPNQLPALVSDSGKKLNHGRSLIERLMSIEFPSELLDVQRRMHPDIVNFPNKEFYDGKLKTEYQGKYDIQALEIINVNGNEQKVGNSYQNKEECLEIIKQYNKFKETFNDIVVISPYKAQCSLLKSINSNLEIHTVDSFQGREADVIILTTVRTGDSVGFWNDYRRLNVALTRAKHVLRIVGKISTWKKSNNKLKKLYEFVN